VIDETNGAVDLVKVDVDTNPRVASTFRVQSIPAVFAIKDRKVVDSFIGALPEPAVRQWVASLISPPTEVEQLLATGDEASLRRALELEPANEQAVLALASKLVERSEGSEALGLLARIPETAEVRRIAALARVGDEVAGAGDTEMEAKLDALLDRVKGDDEARQEFLDLLELLGPDDPRTPQYRRALASRLY
jgi:putative thioredoxin